MRTANSRAININSDGSVVNVPAIEGYAASDVEDGTPDSYYGFLDAGGNWYIMKGTINGSEINYTYVRGTSGYAASWAGRAGLSYDIYSAIF